MSSSPEPGSSAAPPYTWPELTGVALLLAWYLFTALSAVATKSGTMDEAYHLAAGHCYWKLGDFRMQPENGNLPQRWAAIPVVALGYKFPRLDQDSWINSEMDVIGDEFLYGLGNDDWMLMWGRAMIALLGLALGALIYVWTRHMLGRLAAFISLTLFAFCPTMLAGAAFVTSDMAATLFFMASLGALWKVLRRVTVTWLVISCLTTGLLFVAKYSAVMLIPMMLLLVAVQLVSPHPVLLAFGRRVREVHSRWRRLGVQIGVLAAHALVTWVVIWGFFNFRYLMFAEVTVGRDAPDAPLRVLDHPRYAWDVILKPERGLIDRLSLYGLEWHALPQAYIYGFIHTYHFALERRAFLNGHYSKQGFPEFFPYCLLVKTPLPLFALMFLGLLALALDWHGGSARAPAERRAAMFASLYRAAPLIALFGVYWAFAVTSHLNIGQRHIMPTYPPMFMLAGAAALWLRAPVVGSLPQWGWFATHKHPAARVAVCALMALFAGESLYRWPNYLAYFNIVCGGPWNAYKHLVDSSLDWGQDVPALKKWLDDNGLDNSPGKKVYLSLFGHATPFHYKIEAEHLASFPGFAPIGIPKMPSGGTYCISASMLWGLYTSYYGAWNKKYEAEYQEMRAQMREFESTANDPAARQRWVEKMGGEKALAEWFPKYERCIFARLSTYLRTLEPEDEINYSILVFRLSDDEVRRALDGPPSELVDRVST